MLHTTNSSIQFLAESPPATPPPPSPALENILSAFSHVNWNGISCSSVLIPILKGFNTGVVIYDLERLREINHLREYISPEYIKYLVNKYMFFGTVGDQVQKYIFSVLTRTNNFHCTLAEVPGCAR